MRRALPTCRETGLRLIPLLVVLTLSLTGCTTVNDRAPADVRAMEFRPAGLEESASAAFPAFLTRFPFPDLIVEIHHSPEYAPSALALDALERTLRQVVDKRSVRLLDPSPLSGWAGESRTWTIEDLERISVEQSHLRLRFHQYGAQSTAVLQVFYLAGEYAEPASGVNHDSHIYLFTGADDPIVALEATRERFERNTLIHELGHALGLVNCGIPMLTSREDAESRCHSTNTESVMYRAASVKMEPMRLLDDSWVPYEFDEHDLADIESFQRHFNLR